MRLPTHLLFVILAVSQARAIDRQIEFNRDIRPILSNNCFYCHGPDQHKRKAGLRLDSREGATADRKGSLAIDPDDLQGSELIARILSDDPDEMMPPPETHQRLTDSEKQLLTRWVTEGAQYQDHWSFIAPKKVALPDGGASNPIDSFVERRLQSAGLQPLPAADRETIIRRVTFDITGLPPTTAQVDAFLADSSPDAYEKVVDRLLASPHYGERMTLDWMDAARYGDSSVMHADGPRDMWPWRDWVIKAYNDNMPFDQFTVEQIAGDLLPDATTSQKIASGFNRNHATSDEGGAIPEELRVSYVVDRVKTTSTVWLAMSLECAQCHDHKYDPISQKDYYSFFAYFNNTTDPGMQTRNGNQAPVVQVISNEAQQDIEAAAKRHEEAGKLVEQHRQSSEPAFQDWLARRQENAAGLTAEPAGLAHHFPLAERNGAEIEDAITKKKARVAGKFQPTKRDNLDEGHRFDGKSSFAFTDFPGRERDQPFTFSAWLKLPQTSGGSVLARMDVDSGYRGYDLWVQGRTIGTHIINEWPSNALKVVSQEELAPNRWQHVSVTYDGSSKADGINIYIDGRLATNVVEQDSLTESVSTQTPFRIGSRSKGGHFTGEAGDLRIYDRVLSQQEIAGLSGAPVAPILATAPEKRTPEQQKQLRDFYFSTADEKFRALTAEVAKLAAAEKSLRDQHKVTSMIMQDQVKNPRMTYVLDRGQYDAPIKDEVIEAGVPEALGALPADAPPNRLGLAQWLTQPDHPLTSRVAVNRLWATFFGIGLVETTGDFGNQGEWPSHPELLDWLAVDFVESGWDVKRAIRQIVTSETYRRSSRSTPQFLQEDPENRLLARGPRFRLHAEFIRDNALAVSGLLVPTIGPGVKPYQPANIWNEVSLNGGLRYKRDSGEKLYRRAMYTYWKRSAPLPSMLIFDVPTREMCSVQRPRTNTPLQALVTLNDPQFVEAARALAERLIREGGETAESRIDLAFRLNTARHPNAREVDVLTATLAAQTERFKADPQKAEEFLKVGESRRDESIDPIEHAAWSVISQMVLNLDETITRG